MIVLDTHAWIWFVDQPELLPPTTLQQVEAALTAGKVHVSSISVWEILMLEAKGRLSFRLPAQVWVERCEETDCFGFVPVNNPISRLSVSLGLHGDPADRFIAATAVYLGATLVTRDRRLRASPVVQTTW